MVHLTTREHYENACRILKTDEPAFAQAVCGAIPNSRFLTTVLERVDCPRCRDLGTEAQQTEAEPPITRWRVAAAALAVSEDTLARRRRESDPNRRCHFATRSDLFQWWATVNQGKDGQGPLESRPTRRRKKTSVASAEPVDWTTLGTDLAEGRKG